MAEMWGNRGWGVGEAQETVEEACLGESSVTES